MEDITQYRGILKDVQTQLNQNYVHSQLYKQEFDHLKLHSDGLILTETQVDGWLQYNRSKNRYKDILPYDRSRVKLPTINNIPGSDYINASHISGPPGFTNYIAAQGPLPNTVFDFWRMVWYNYVSVIVMVCKQFEMGKEKCACYWGKSVGDCQKWGNFNVKLVHEAWEKHFVVRTLLLNCAEVSREVYQYQYMDWPDRDVPSEVEPLHQMLQMARDRCPQRTCYNNTAGTPILIHCSAGCGRTGTVLGIDYVDTLIRQNQLTQKFSIYEMIKQMRCERVAICQTKQQYGFVYYTAIQLLQSAIDTLDLRKEAVSETIYENVPVSPHAREEEEEEVVVTSPTRSKPPPPPKPDKKRPSPAPKPDTLPRQRSEEKPAPPPKPDLKLELKAEPRVDLKQEVKAVAPAGDSREPLYASINPSTRTSKLIDLGDEEDSEAPPLPKALETDSEGEMPTNQQPVPPPSPSMRDLGVRSTGPPALRPSAPRSPVPLRGVKSGVSPSLPASSPPFLQSPPPATNTGNQVNQAAVNAALLPRFDEDNSSQFSELSIPHSDVALEASSEEVEEDEDLYETMGETRVDGMRSSSKDNNRAAEPVSRKFTIGGKKLKSKSFGFKGLLSNMTDSAAHLGGTFSKTVSHMGAPATATPGNTGNAGTLSDLTEINYVYEFGKRTARPRGPRDMPAHWINA